MDDFFLLFDGLDSHGPGTAEDTLAALALVPRPVRTVLDIGCGPGNATLLLAEHTGAQVTALDSHEPSLARLAARAIPAGLGERITTVSADMAELPFEPGRFDLIWCETSVYNLGFAEALTRWRAFLAHPGTLVVSDLVWMVEEPPSDMISFWQQEYPDMVPLPRRIEQATGLGYDVLATHALGHDAWAAYYEPLAERVVAMRDQLADPALADGLLEEVAMLKRQVTGAFNYVFFVLEPHQPQ